MPVPENSQNRIIGEEAENVTYVFPKSEKIVIHRSDLQIQLEKFKEKTKAAFSAFDLLAIISLWSPLFGAEFKSIFGLEPKELRAGYVVFACLITLFILWSRIKYSILDFWKKESVSSDASEMAVKILEQCQSRPKNT